MQLRFLQKNKEGKDMIIAVAGSGGKTTRVHKLAQYYRSLGKKVFVTTTTHMKKESDTVIPENIEDIRKQLNETGYCMAGMPATPENALVQKIGPLPEDFYETAVKEADITLIEADGSRGMPAKIPADYEPVIPENIDEIHIVIGMSALGKPASKVVHRLSLADKDLEIKEDTILTPLHLQKLLKKGYLGPLREQYKDTKIKVYPGQADTLYQRVIARFLQEEKDVAQIKDDWFKIQPKLVIFGAGHVAIQLLRIAKFLDFYTIMIDDREEFADSEKLSQADEVYCRDFHDIEDILPEQDNAFYVVVTRGHANDRLCAETVLRRPYLYLGMIGSKGKVAKTFEIMKEEGYSEEQISTIHAPIGLKIGARTPEEIAISIAAEMIAIKNHETESTMSKELFETKESGVLCIITKKSGSSPRGVGSMMLVTKDGIIGSIGGGNLEKTVMEEAPSMKEITRKKYDLSNAQSAILGMICGGKNEILYVPV